MRVEILDADPSWRYSVPDEFMSPKNAKYEMDRSLNLEEMSQRFKVEITPASELKKKNQSEFIMRAYHT
jgi:hypothetical protein